MTLRGLPDFGAPVRVQGAIAGYTAFEDRSLVLVPPRSLQLSRREDGRPAFSMERFRPRSGTWPEPYGVVTMTMEPERPMEEVLEVARAADTTRAAPATLATGNFTMVGIDRATDLAWDGIGPITWSERVTPEEITLLRGAVEGAVPGINAGAVVEVVGVSARAAAIVTIEPESLSTGLMELRAVGAGELGRADVVNWLRTRVLPGTGDPPRILLGVDGAPPPEAEFAEALVDRIRARWPRFAPTEPEPPGTWQWDLHHELATWREHQLVLPLFDAFTEVAAHLDHHQPPGVDLNPVPAGWRTVTVLANLPTQQAGMEACGVDITAAPRPPTRPQAATATIDLGHEGPTSSATIRLAPGEEPDFVRQTWAIVTNEQHEVRELRGDLVAFHGERLTLRPTDFPVQFVPIDVEPALLDLATVCVSFRREDGGPILGPTDFEINSPHADLGVPERDHLTMNVQLTARAETGSLTLGPYPAEPRWIGRHLLPSWGPHHITVTGTGEALTAVALRPESSTDDGDVVTTTPTEPVRTWTWFTNDPFRSGYQFRVVPLGTEPGPWSPVRTYDQPLDLAGIPT